MFGICRLLLAFVFLFVDSYVLSACVVFVCCVSVAVLFFACSLVVVYSLLRFLFAVCCLFLLFADFVMCFMYVVGIRCSCSLLILGCCWCLLLFLVALLLCSSCL